jgi:hypothetical protein
MRKGKASTYGSMIYSSKYPPHPSTDFPLTSQKNTNVSEIVQIWQTKQKTGIQNVVIP